MQQERLRALGQMASGIAHDINNAISPVTLYVESPCSTHETGFRRARAQAARDHPARDRRCRAHRGAHGRVLSPAARRQLDARAGGRQRRRFAAGARAHARALERHGAATRRGHRDESRERRRSTDDDGHRERAARGADQPGVQRRRRHARRRRAHAAHAATRSRPARRSRAACSSRSATPASGMDEDTRRRCLEPFFTTKGERGSGLGLAMVYGIAQRHGADIEIASAPGEGTTVRLTFPPARADGAVDRQHSRMPARSRGTRGSC